MEAPCAKEIFRHPTITNLSRKETVSTAKGDLSKYGFKDRSGSFITRSTWWLSSSQDFIDSIGYKEPLRRTQTTILSTPLSARHRLPAGLARDVIIGFEKTLSIKEPDRVKSLARALDARISAVGMLADCYMVEFAEHYKHLPFAAPCEQVYANIKENEDIPEAGSEFDLPAHLHGKIPKSLMSSVRRLHFNSGHPPNAELERIVRLSGGSELAREAVKGTHCTICRKAAPPKSAKPGKVKMNIGLFNDTVLIDLAYEKESEGTTHGWGIIVDEGTDWCVCKYIDNGKSSAEFL